MGLEHRSARIHVSQQEFLEEHDVNFSKWARDELWDAMEEWGEEPPEEYQKE